MPVLLALALAGCAHADRPSVQFAQGDPPLCKHCNCYMPAGIPDDAPCTVCNCGYAAGQCIRGK